MSQTKKIVALFYGSMVTEDLRTEKVVVEIEEIRKRVHVYIPYALEAGKVLEISPSHFHFDDESQLPPAPVLRQFPWYTWRRLR